jgi:hypothetical protein
MISQVKSFLYRSGLAAAHGFGTIPTRTGDNGFCSGSHPGPAPMFAAEDRACRPLVADLGAAIGCTTRRRSRTGMQPPPAITTKRAIGPRSPAPAPRPIRRCVQPPPPPRGCCCPARTSRADGPRQQDAAAAESGGAQAAASAVSAHAGTGWRATASALSAHAGSGCVAAAGVAGGSRRM